MSQNKLLCNCGHDARVHFGVERGWDPHCRICYALYIKDLRAGKAVNINVHLRSICSHYFVLDNLKYLESKYEAKHG